MSISAALIKQFENITKTYSQSSDCIAYSYDNSRRQVLPDAVIFPDSHEQVVEIVNICNQHLIPITARGKGTATTGATVPVSHGLVISFEQMNQIVEFDAANRLIIVEPGVTNQQVQNLAGQSGFFWPPDPSSSAFCSIGGNLSCNSAGPRAVKYGTTRDHILGLKCVTGEGKTLISGAKTTKAVVGYDFTRLIVGSEGTLALITSSTLKLLPKPEKKISLQIFYDSIQAAGNAIIALMTQPIIPCALEFIDHHAIAMIKDYSDVYLPDNAKAMLMLEIDGDSQSIQAYSESIKKVIIKTACLELIEAKTEQQISQLWKTRKALSPALRKVAPKKINEDVVVPISHIAEFLFQLDKLAENYQIKIVNFGHAGNGNIHVNLMVDPEDPQQMKNAYSCLKDIFKTVLDFGGTLSGEHGIGLEKKDYLSLELDDYYLSLMKKIKLQFDPNGILNPGKYGS